MKKLTMDGPCCVWDWVGHINPGKDQTAGHEEIIKWLEKVAKKWSFQIEEGEKTKCLHYQGRLSLKMKKRDGWYVNGDYACPWKWFNWSRTSTENRDNAFYCTKEEGRIAGPWKDTDEKPRYVPRQVREIKEWRPYQLTITDSFGVWDTRGINVVIDRGGNIGKTVLAIALMCAGVAEYIPFCNDFKDIMRMVMDKKKVGGYIIDIPRAISKEKLFGLMAGIEMMKSGYCFDDRYKFKDEVIDCPVIWMFINIKPDISLLSSDRWKLWEVNRITWTLEKYVPPAEPEISSENVESSVKVDN